MKRSMIPHVTSSFILRTRLLKYKVTTFYYTPVCVDYIKLSLPTILLLFCTINLLLPLFSLYRKRLLTVRVLAYFSRPRRKVPPTLPIRAFFLIHNVFGVTLFRTVRLHHFLDRHDYREHDSIVPVLTVPHLDLSIVPGVECPRAVGKIP